MSTALSHQPRYVIGLYRFSTAEQGRSQVVRSGFARATNERTFPTPSGAGTWTHTTVARLLRRVAA